ERDRSRPGRIERRVHVWLLRRYALSKVLPDPLASRVEIRDRNRFPHEVDDVGEGRIDVGWPLRAPVHEPLLPLAVAGVSPRRVRRVGRLRRARRGGGWRGVPAPARAFPLLGRGGRAPRPRRLPRGRPPPPAPVPCPAVARPAGARSRRRALPARSWPRRSP